MANDLTSITERTWTGGVKSRTGADAVVQFPVTITLEGQEIGLSLSDAQRLATGLGDAIADLKAAGCESARFVMMPTRQGMSWTCKPSKLPEGPSEVASPFFPGGATCYFDASLHAPRSDKSQPPKLAQQKP